MGFTDPQAHLSHCPLSFFYFYIFFVDLSKIYVGIIFFQKCHPAAGSIGGKYYRRAVARL
jgi:hypothetical protein